MVDILLEQGHPVRAFVRQDDERAHSLRQAGAEVFVGDLLTIADVTAALKGVRRIYFSMSDPEPPWTASSGHALFNAQRVQAAVPMIDAVADELLDGVRGQLDSTGGCDLFPSFAQVLPRRVLMELLGIHGIAPATLIRWSDAALKAFWGGTHSSASWSRQHASGVGFAGHLAEGGRGRGHRVRSARLQRG